MPSVSMHRGPGPHARVRLTGRAKRSRVIGAAGALAVCAVTAIGLAVRTDATDVPAGGGSVVSQPSLGAASAAADAGQRHAASRAARPLPSADPTTTRIPAHTYFVNCSTGDDAGPGSAARPWRSLEPVRAITFPVDSGIYLARGCTWDEPLEVLGLAAGRLGVLVTGYGSGAAPVISGRGQSGASPVSLLSDRVDLSGVDVTSATRYAIQLFGTGDAVRGATITGSGIGVRAIGADAVMDHVQVSDLHMIVNTPGGDDDYGAVGFDVEAVGAEVSNSSCTNCRAPSDDWGHDGGFVEIWDHGDGLYVHDNLATNDEGFIEIGGNAPAGTARNVRIVNNTMNEVHGGVFVHNVGTTFGISSNDILVQGNRITNRQPSPGGVFAGYVGTLDIRDNIIISNGPVAFAEPWRHSGNTFYVDSLADLGFTPSATETVQPLSAAP